MQSSGSRIASSMTLIVSWTLIFIWLSKSETCLHITLPSKNPQLWFTKGLTLRFSQTMSTTTSKKRTIWGCCCQRQLESSLMLCDLLFECLQDIWRIVAICLLESILFVISFVCHQLDFDLNNCLKLFVCGKFINNRNKYFWFWLFYYFFTNM